MAAMGAPPTYPYVAVSSPLKNRPHRKYASLSRRSAVSTSHQSSNSSVPTSVPSTRTGGLEEGHISVRQATEVNRVGAGIAVEGDGGGKNEKSVGDYFEQAAVLMNSTGSDGSGPRWFTPVECGSPRLNDVPLFLYLPGVDGVGLGLVRHHEKLGKIFDVWCLHIPAMDRTPFAELVKLVDATVKSKHSRSPRRPIYLVGESLGACLAFAVASRNPNIDLVLISVNPATSFSKSPLQSLASLLAPVQPLFSNASLLNLVIRGDSLMPFVDAVENALGQSQVAKDLLQGLRSLSNYSAVADIFPRDTLLWKMAMLRDACTHANSRLHAVKAQHLVLASGKDPLLPSQEEGERLRRVLPKCEIRKFNDNGHFLLLEDGVDLVYILKGASFYRRGRAHDYVADFLPPSASDIKKVQEQYWWCDPVLSPVMLSTLEDGKIVNGLDGLPSEGPTLLVGYHMLMGLELAPLVLRILTEKNILVRGIAHPLLFFRSGESKRLPELSTNDTVRLMGAVPVSGTNLFKLLASKSHVLLYPGGMREALHRKGEEYQLFWPEQSEFVRMAARFGAKIVPFGAVGEDDIGQLVLDYDDLVRIPYVKEQIEQLTAETIRLRTDSSGEVANQQVHFPVALPKIPGRFYYLLGKPIDLSDRKHELKDRQKAQEVYLEVKAEVEKCLAYLKEKRETDPYRSIMARLVYKSAHGQDSEIPTFEL